MKNTTKIERKILYIISYRCQLISYTTRFIFHITTTTTTITTTTTLLTITPPRYAQPAAPHHPPPPTGTPYHPPFLPIFSCLPCLPFHTLQTTGISSMQSFLSSQLAFPVYVYLCRCSCSSALLPQLLSFHIPLSIFSPPSTFVFFSSSPFTSISCSFVFHSFH